MIKSSYETSPCRDHVIGKLRTALEANWISSGLGEQFRFVKHPRTNEDMPLVELLPGPADIPPFAHPLAIAPNGWEKGLLVMDVRNFVKRTANNEFVVSSVLDYTTLRNRAILEVVANQQDGQALLSTGNIHVTVFIRWLSDAIGRRLALPPETQLRLTTLVGLFYLGQFLDLNLDEENDRTKAAVLISRSTFIPVEDVLREIAEVETIPNGVYHFIDTVKRHGNSARFDNLNVALLYNVLYAGSWFGSNKNELINVAVEHPPTFLGMVMTAAQERGYKDTNIGKLLKVYDKNDAVKGFLYNVWHLPVSYN